MFPIESYTGISEIHFIDYELGKASFDVYECRVRGITYSIPLKIRVKFLQFHKSSVDKHKYNKNQENKHKKKKT
jgi:DNA-directed RNA polymerase subunit beta